MVDLSQLYSNHTTLWEYVNKVKSTTDNTTESDDAKYPYPKEKVIRSITQHQKRLSKLEIQTICERYQNGASIYKLAADFGCHRRTISDKKGMGEKVKGGGTVGRAPLGYINVRRIDDKGREERTVELDPERAPLVKQAFEEYATGEWSIISLAEYMAALGLSTRPTPKIPSKPVTKTSIEKMLKNPYYAGVIRYNGIEYDGAHEALIDLETFNKVQNIIQSHHNGERTREHPHFLKGLVYCWNCKSRMVVTHAKSHTGNVYPYFICAGRHRTKSARQTCKMRSILIDEVEYQLEKIFDNYSIKPEDRFLLEAQIQDFINKENEKFKTELDALRREKEKIEHKQEKLLEAHFGSVPNSV